MCTNVRAFLPFFLPSFLPSFPPSFLPCLLPSPSILPKPHRHLVEWCQCPRAARATLTPRRRAVAGGFGVLFLVPSDALSQQEAVAVAVAVVPAA